MTGSFPSTTDGLIVGAGIAGGSLAAALATYRSVLMIEAEEQPGYHATRRSAAFSTERYGAAGAAPLSSASFASLARPSAEFDEPPFLSPPTGLTNRRAADDGARHGCAAG